MLGKQLKCSYCGNTEFSQPIKGEKIMNAYLQPDGSIEYTVIDTELESDDMYDEIVCDGCLRVVTRSSVTKFYTKLEELKNSTVEEVNNERSN